MRRLALAGLVLLLAALGLAACGEDDDDGATAATPANTASTSEEVTVELDEQDGSGEAGTATLTAMGEETEVVLELTNPTTPSQPAHIHEGSCGPTLDPTPLHGLPNVLDGRSETVVNASLAELTAGDLAINVHQSDAALEDYVACGSIPVAAGAAAGAGGADETSPSEDLPSGY